MSGAEWWMTSGLCSHTTDERSPRRGPTPSTLAWQGDGKEKARRYGSLYYLCNEAPTAAWAGNWRSLLLAGDACIGPVWTRLCVTTTNHGILPASIVYSKLRTLFQNQIQFQACLNKPPMVRCKVANLYNICHRATLSSKRDSKYSL